MNKVFLVAALSVAATGVASAESMGTVASVSGEQGSVIAVRSGAVNVLNAGDALFDGDRIFVRTGGAAEIVTGGCTLSLPSYSSAVMGAAVCQGPAGGGGALGGGGFGGALGTGFTATQLGLLGLGGLLAVGALTGTLDDVFGGDDGPTSP